MYACMFVHTTSPLLVLLEPKRRVFSPLRAIITQIIRHSKESINWHFIRETGYRVNLRLETANSFVPLCKGFAVTLSKVPPLPKKMKTGVMVISFISTCNDIDWGLNSEECSCDSQLTRYINKKMLNRTEAWQLLWRAGDSSIELRQGVMLTSMSVEERSTDHRQLSSPFPRLLCQNLVQLFSTEYSGGRPREGVKRWLRMGTSMDLLWPSSIIENCQEAVYNFAVDVLWGMHA